MYYKKRKKGETVKTKVGSRGYCRNCKKPFTVGRPEYSGGLCYKCDSTMKAHEQDKVNYPRNRAIW